MVLFHGEGPQVPESQDGGGNDSIIQQPTSKAWLLVPRILLCWSRPPGSEGGTNWLENWTFSSGHMQVSPKAVETHSAKTSLGPPKTFSNMTMLHITP